MDSAEVLKVAEQVAEALADAHEHGIVHRDVKPGNVMLSERGVVKVLDFGLARFAPPAHEDSLTWSGEARRARGDDRGNPRLHVSRAGARPPVDARSDVFSLGVVLYEMLAGRKPFSGRNMVELVDEVLRRDPDPLSAQGPLASGLGVLALRMLEKDKALRPADMREVLGQLAAVRSGEAPAVGAGREPHDRRDRLRQHHRAARRRLARDRSRREPERRARGRARHRGGLARADPRGAARAGVVGRAATTRASPCASAASWARAAS